LTGRTPGDTHPIFKITKPCDPNLFAGSPEPMFTEVPKGCGTAIVVRRDGATVRSSVNVDASAVIHKLKYRQSVFFDKRVRIEPTDRRCIPVIRMHVYVTDTGGKVTTDGWVSLTGRTIADKAPIFKITRECTIGRPVKKRIDPFRWLFRNRAAESKELDDTSEPPVNAESHELKMGQEGSEDTDKQAGLYQEG